MQKVYLILRNNKQEGPFSLQELERLPVKATDLIWVEGKSAAWRYPAEITELQPLISPTPGTTPNHTNQYKATATQVDERSQNQKGAKKIFVSLPDGQNKQTRFEESLPTDPIEQKAEALRQRLQSYQPTSPIIPEDVVETRLNRSMDDVAGDYASWAIHHNAKKKHFTKNKNLLAAAVVLLLLVVNGYFVFKPSSATKAINKPAEIAVQEKEVSDSPSVTAAVEITNQHIEPDVAVNEKRKEKVLHNPTTQKENNAVAIVQNKPKTEGITTDESPLPVEEPTAEPASTQNEPQKKKSIGAAIDGFFEQFKSKNKEPKSETAGTTGERKSTKRSEETNEEAKQVDVTQQVKLSSNAPAENWMLGIKGQKLTLQNSSNVLIKSALVEVEYYNEEETLLEKKKVEFKNIKPNQKATQPIPDHRLASFTRQQVLSATGFLHVEN